MAHDTEKPGQFDNLSGIRGPLARMLGQFDQSEFDDQERKNGSGEKPPIKRRSFRLFGNRSGKNAKAVAEDNTVAEQIQAEIENIEKHSIQPLASAKPLTFKRRISSQANAIGGNIRENYSKINDYTAEKVSPQLGQAGDYIKKRLQPETLEQRWRKFLLSFHERFVDQKTEHLYFVPTSVEEQLNQLTITSSHKHAGKDYRPTPRKVFRWALEALPQDLRHFTFVDMGAGRGRALLMASRHNFRRIVGAEFAQELHDDAQMNIAQFPRSLMKCRDVECINITASKLTMPHGAAVFYFFDPFDESVLKHVLSRIVEAYRVSPRRFYLVVVDADYDDLIEQQQVFKPLSYSLSQRVKQKLFSPYPIRAYRTIV